MAIQLTETFWLSLTKITKATSTFRHYLMKKLIILLTILFALTSLIASYNTFTSNDAASDQKPIAQQGHFSQEQPTLVDNLFLEYGKNTELTIPYLRSLDYQASPITFERKLRALTNYEEYYVSFNAGDLTQYALLTKPLAATVDEKVPAIIFLHGYIPPSEYQTTKKYEDYVAYLANQGFAVMKLDFRGHDQSEGKPTGAYFSSGYVIDSLVAYESIKKLDFVDANKIGYWGHSMSGNVTLRAMAVNDDIKAGVIWAGAGFSYADLQKYRIQDFSYVRPTSPTPMASDSPRRSLFSAEDEIPEFWNYVAATNYMENMDGKLQLHHAVNDNVVNVDYSRDLSYILNDKGLSHEFYEYQNGGHNLNSPSFTLAMQRTVKFYNKVFEENESDNSI